jgi:formyltetrahydrofolate-dependent phosphoribosylglycinamide formyltransferase
MPRSGRRLTVNGMGKLRIAVALSGGGRTLENFFEKIAAGVLDAEITSVASSNSKAFGLQRAKRRNIPTSVFLRKQFSSDEAYSAAIIKFFNERPADLILLAGFMKLFHVPPEWTGRVMNIHPALIPAFCGRGLYGHHVHEAVIKKGVNVSGCTVHFVDNVYDHGQTIVQRVAPVKPGDTPDTLADRVFAEECAAYPEAVRLFQAGKITADPDFKRSENGWRLSDSQWKKIRPILPNEKNKREVFERLIWKLVTGKKPRKNDKAAARLKTWINMGAWLKAILALFSEINGTDYSASGDSIWDKSILDGSFSITM